MFRILLADDSKTIQKVVKLTLSGEGYQVDCFEDGHAALEHALRFGADLVLADVDLPGQGGYELCRNIKRQLETAAIPVVLLAGSLKPIDAERSNWAGVDATLTKPFETSRLFDLIEELTERRKAGAEARAAVPGIPELDAEEQAHLDLPQEPELLFQLSREECRPRFRLLSSRAWAGPVAGEITDAQFQAILAAVSEKLPETLRELLPGVTRDILRP